ncbi:MAG: hypothetical protein V4674_02110 [Patescibacteria group bacterium]
MKRNALKAGFGIVEVVVGSAVIAVVVFGFTSLSAQLLRTSYANSDRVKAVHLSEEGIEAIRFIRDSDWNTFSALTNGASYDVVLSGGVWQASASRSMIDGRFLRTVMLSSVYRDTAGAVVASGGTLDADSRKVVVSIEWKNHASTTPAAASTTETISTYLNRIF